MYNCTSELPFFYICNHGKLPFSTWPIKKLVQELIWNSKVYQKISMPLFGYNLQKKSWMVSFKWFVWMLKGLLCLKDIKSVWLPNDFPEIHIHSSVYFMITNTVSALHLWQIEAVNDVQWCMFYLCWFSRGQVFPHPRGNLHWLHRGRNLVDCCFLGLYSLTRE